MSLSCSVIGAGSWGTALAIQLARRGHDTVLWDRHPERCEAMNRDHRNPRYLTSVPLPPSLRAESDLARAVSRASLLVMAVPSHALRATVEQAAPHLREDVLSICCATKGVEDGTLLTMHDLIEDVLPDALDPAVTVLSGPSFALEVGRGLPTAVVVAGPDRAASAVADAFHGEAFRVYHTHDSVGVCLGGSLKNVMAIACGISDGLGLGANARAGLITRGLAEVSRLVIACGGQPQTMMGLAGVGDLVLTCTDDLSRNRRVGLALGKGRTLEQILEELGEVAEGVRAARSALALGRARGVELPITEQVHAILYEGRSARGALQELMGRDRKSE